MEIKKNKINNYMLINFKVLLLNLLGGTLEDVLNSNTLFFIPLCVWNIIITNSCQTNIVRFFSFFFACWSIDMKTPQIARLQFQFPDPYNCCCVS